MAFVESALNEVHDDDIRHEGKAPSSPHAELERAISRYASINRSILIIWLMRQLKILVIHTYGMLP